MTTEINPHLSITPKPLCREVASNILFGLYSTLLKMILSWDEEREVVILGKGSEISNNQMKHIREFRSKHYLHYSSWQLEEEGAEDIFTDRVSYHVMALRKNRIYGVLRVTPFPFTCHKSSSFPLGFIQGKENYLEFNKLVTLKSDKRLNKMLMIIAAIYAHSNLKGDGLVALSRSGQKKTFERMGLQQEGSDFTIFEKENQSFAFMSSSYGELFLRNMLNLLSGRML